jgi:nucleotide-binding universal stress UspA family protein
MEAIMNAVNRGKADGKYVVLAGIDFSETSSEVLRAAADLARPGSELHLVYVRHDAPSESTATMSQDRQVAFASHIDEVHVKLEEVGRQVLDPSRRVVLHTRVGRPDVEIAQLASDIEADMLVIGTHGRTGLKRLVLGSVAESLVRYAPCSVLTLHSKTVPPWEQIEPPCPDCIAVQRETQRSRFLCERHAKRHPRAHTYSEIPPSFGIGAQTFRGV